MIIGSTSSLTYQQPKSWWKRLIWRLTRHQEVDYEIQYKFYGVRLFELKLYVDKKNKLVIKNDGMTYKIFSLYQILDFFDKMGDVSVLVTLNESFDDYVYDGDIHTIEKKFIENCKAFETIYENIMFYGGYREFDKKQLFKFTWEEQHDEISVIKPDDWSIIYRLVQRFCPFLVRKLNKAYIEKYDKFQGFLMLSYVNRR